MLIDSLASPFSVSFSTCESDNILLSSILLLWLSSFFSKILTYNRKRPPPPPPPPPIVSNCNKNHSLAADSAENFDLPDDAWVEVLCRLPPKGMVRFKLVSKSWNFLISKTCIPKFTSPLYGLFVPSGFPIRSSHYNHKTTPGIWDFACCVDGTGINNNGTSFVQSCFRTLPFTPSPLSFLDSCNGFLLFFDKQSFRFYVCNPTTQQYIALPRAPEIYIPLAASLTFTPHFNVVCFLRCPLRMMIYYSETHNWVVHTGLHLKRSINAARFSSRPALIDGVLYFVSSSGHLLKLDTQRVSVKLIRLPKPVKVRGSTDMGCIGVSTNRLHYAWDDLNTHNLFVWMLTDRRWILKHSFSLLDLAKYSMPHISEIFSMLAPYSFHPTSDVIFLGHEAGIFQYDPVSKKLDCVYRLSNGTSISCGRLMVQPFVRSLATMNGFIPSIRKKRRGKKKSAATAT